MALHTTLSAMNRALPGLKRIVPFSVYRCVMRTFFSSVTEFSNKPHRQWIEHEMLPQFAVQKPGVLVFVGCAPYTWHYEKLFRGTGTDYITIDPLPAARVWGSRHHYIGIIQDLYQRLPAHSVDVLVMIGVYGFGLTNDAELHDALVGIHKVLKPSGIFVLSWNNDVSTDPQNHADLNGLFHRTEVFGFPSRKTFDSTLALDFYRSSLAEKEIVQ